MSTPQDMPNTINEQPQPSCINSETQAVPNITRRSSHMILRPYHHIILCKNKLDVSTNNVTVFFNTQLTPPADDGWNRFFACRYKLTSMAF